MSRDMPGLRICSIIHGVTPTESDRSYARLHTAKERWFSVLWAEGGMVGAGLISVTQVRPLLISPCAPDILYFSTGELAGCKEKCTKVTIKMKGNFLHSQCVLRLLGCRRVIPEHGKCLRGLLAFRSSIICKSVRDGSGFGCANYSFYWV